MDMISHTDPEAITTSPATDQVESLNQEHTEHNPTTGIGPLSHAYNSAEEEELEQEMQQLETLDDERINKTLFIFNWIKEQQQKVLNSKAEADARQKELRIAAEAALNTLPESEAQAVIAWIGARDRLQQYQGALNILNRIMTPVHNLNAGTLSAQIVVAKIRRENRRIREIALVNGVKLPRSITRKRR